MDTKNKGGKPISLVRMTAMVRADTQQALQELADARNEGKVSREIRRALDEFVEREKAAA